jgi:predicted ATPase
MTKGYAAEEVERTYARARELCQTLGEQPQLLPALAGLFRFYFVRAEFPTTRALGEQVLRLAEHSGDPVVFLVAHSLLGALLVSCGEFAAGHEHLQYGIARYDRREHGLMASLYGDDPGVTCHSFAGLSLWLLGYPDRALASVQNGLTIAKETGSPYCETFALDFVTWVHVLRREANAAQASVDALMRNAPEQGFPFLLADAGVLRSWILAARGLGAEGMRQVRPAIAAYAATGAVMSRPAHLMLLAQVCRTAGRLKEALTAVADAWTTVEQTGERSYEAELHRLQGELTLDLWRRNGRKRQTEFGAIAEAEDCFRNALAVARRQQAKSLELRAAIALATLWAERGTRRQAHDMLSEIYTWFREGFDTPDLLDAQTLLAALA